MLIFTIIFIIFLIFCFTAFTGAPYVPSRKSHLHTAFTQLYRLSPKDYLIDLGAGDGKVIATARQYGASALGLELNPFLALYATIRLKLTHNTAPASTSHSSHSTSTSRPSAHVRCTNFFTFNFPSETTVLYVFGDSRDILKIYQKIQSEATRLHKPLYLISLAFDVPHHQPLKKVSPYYLYKISPLDSESTSGC